MRPWWIFFLFISFWPWEKEPGQLKKSSFALSGPPVLLKTVRVALFYEKSQVHVNIPAPYEITSLPENQSLVQSPSPSSVTIRREQDGIRIGANLYPVAGVRIASKNKMLEIENQKYRNALQILKNPAGSLTVVNEVDTEDYLKGVLPAEMNPAWPPEALKAQAVVSRTYAIFKNIENKDFSFTLGPDVGSQVYRGTSVEHPSTNQAVAATRGKILTYRGKIFPAFFHSTCGGRTTRADYQWKIEPHPALKGVECPFCAGSKYFVWKARFSPEEIQNRLRKKGYRVSGIQEISPDEIDASERPRFFVVHHSEGRLKIPANDFRLALGVDQMRSLRVKIDKIGDQFFFRGRGWGHGVGLCQFGARRLAELGYPYADILRYYYPGIEVEDLGDIAGLGGSGPTETEKEGKGFKGLFRKIKSYVEEL